MEETPNIILPRTIDNLTLPAPNLLNFYKDLENRQYWIDYEIDGGSLDLIQYIIYINQQDKDIPIEKRKPFKLFFFSSGGELDVQSSLTSIIKLSKTPIWGIAVGMVASAASLIYLACHKKYALPNSYFILHRGSASGLSGTFDQVIASIEDYQMQIEKMEEFYEAHTKYTKEELDTILSSDYYVHTEEGLEKGLIDEIVTDIDILL